MVTRLDMELLINIRPEMGFGDEASASRLP